MLQFYCIIAVIEELRKYLFENKHRGQGNLRLQVQCHNQFTTLLSFRLQPLPPKIILAQTEEKFVCARTIYHTIWNFIIYGIILKPDCACSSCTKDSSIWKVSEVPRGDFIRARYQLRWGSIKRLSLLYFLKQFCRSGWRLYWQTIPHTAVKGLHRRRLGGISVDSNRDCSSRLISAVDCCKASGRFIISVTWNCSGPTL